MSDSIRDKKSSIFKVILVFLLIYNVKKKESHLDKIGKRKNRNDKTNSLVSLLTNGNP